VSPDLGAWEPLGLGAAAALFAPAPFSWWVSGGHALDLFVGRPTRPHADLDLSVSRADAPRLRRHLAGWDLRLAHAGVLTPWTAEGLPTPVTSIWCRTGSDRPWCIQVMFEAGTPSDWVSRRHPDLRSPVAEAICRTDAGLPYLAPHLQLVMKAEDTRAKDDDDFLIVFPLLTPEASSWLIAALRRHYPTHHWLSWTEGGRPDGAGRGR
jgi:hypothetical protein